MIGTVECVWFESAGTGCRRHFQLQNLLINLVDLLSLLPGWARSDEQNIPASAKVRFWNF